MNDGVKNIGKYEVVSYLGKGGQGKVYKVRLNTRKEEAFGALKVLNSLEVNELLKEISAWSRVRNHPNILKFLEATEDKGNFLIVSELATGGDLGEWIMEKGGKEEFFGEAEELMLGILAGLEHLHENNIIHRDIKPANIFLKNKTPLLADFGLARALDLTQSSILAGTYLYMSPELLNFWFSADHENESKYERTELDDLWAVSVTFYNMLTGMMPYRNVDAVRNCEPIHIPTNIPASIKDFFRTTFAKTPSKRFQSVVEMCEALKSFKIKQEKHDRRLVLSLNYKGQNAFDTGDYELAISEWEESQKRVWQWEINNLIQTARFELERRKPENNNSGIKEFEYYLHNNLVLEMVSIEPGTFMMGRGWDPRLCFQDHRFHQVTISKGFQIGKYPVTQAQWEVVMGYNPSYFKHCPNCPVENVSWDHVQLFLAKLNQKNDGYVFRLPTEAEWEYTCRAGSEINEYDLNFDQLAWYSKNSGGRTHPVGQKQPNAWGLYDMHGNVYEWCQDWASADYYEKSPERDPTGPAEGESRILRGGNCKVSAEEYLWAGTRGDQRPDFSSELIGFRVVWWTSWTMGRMLINIDG